MSDIVGRLRAKEYGGVERLMDEAADKIEMLEKAHRQLQQELDRMYAENVRLEALLLRWAAWGEGQGHDLEAETRRALERKGE